MCDGARRARRCTAVGEGGEAVPSLRPHRCAVTYGVEPLGDHNLGDFTCGKEELDESLLRHADTATGQGTRTYVLGDDAAKYYEHHDFVALPGSDRRLVMKFSTAAKALPARDGRDEQRVPPLRHTVSLVMNLSASVPTWAPTRSRTGRPERSGHGCPEGGEDVAREPVV